MDTIEQLADRRTSADIVFDVLYKRITDLELLPGARISEVEIARQFDLSRQPVRDAFSRLSNMGLIIIRPQRPTIVRHFSLERIQNARFIRTAVEIEVLRLAATDRDVVTDAPLRENMIRQRAAIDADDAVAFHALDYEFHRLLCLAARSEFAFETIAANKAQVDRLCILSLTDRAAMEKLYADHKEILDGLTCGDTAKVDAAIRRHLERLSPTIREIYETHRDYFDT